MKKLVKSFEPLLREQILMLPTNIYEQYELLNVCEYFDEINDRDREMAVYELILRAPEVSESVAYGELYFELVNYYRWKKDFLNAIQWCYALIAFSEQHDEGMNRANHRLDLANIYLAMENFDVGLTMYSRMLHDVPSNVWLFNNLGLELPRLGLSSLAVKVLDQGLKVVAQKDQYQLKKQFENLRDEAVGLSSTQTSRVSEINPDVLANFQAALHLPIAVSDDDEYEVPYPPQIKRLLEIGVDDAACNEVYAEIIADGRLFIPALIQLAYDPENEAGSAHAIAILQTLRDKYPEELSLLSPWLDQAEGNWQEELLSSTMGKIGGYTTQALQEIAVNIKNDTSIRAAATEALVERTQNFLELWDETVGFFRTLFTRDEAYVPSEERFIARLIIDSLDSGARELYPEIKQVYEEDRLESGWVHLDDVHREWEMPRVPSQRRVDGLYLPLECQKCNRKREHFTEYVLVDINSLGDGKSRSKYDAHILDHEVVCPKCGAVDSYKMTPEAHLRIAGPDDISAMFLPEKEKKAKKRRPNPRVFYFRSAVFGRQMHPFNGLDEYRRRIAKKPKDALLHSKMGSLFRTLMRYSEALEAQRHAYQLAPNDPEVLIRLAFSEHDFGDREAARQLYQKVVDLGSGGKIFEKMDDNMIAAIEGLQNLKRKRPSPTEVILQTSDGKPVKHPSMSWRQSQAQSSGSNDPKEKKKRSRRRRKKK